MHSHASGSTSHHARGPCDDLTVNQSHSEHDGDRPGQWPGDENSGQGGGAAWGPRPPKRRRTEPADTSGPGDPAAHAHAHGHAHSHAHAHGHGPAAPVSRHLRKVIAAVLVPFAAVVLAGLVLMWPGGAPGSDGGRSGVGFDRQMEQARVVQVQEVDCGDVNAEGRQEGDTSAKGLCRQATIKVTSGPHEGREFTEVITPDDTRRLSTGQDVVVAHAPQAPEELQYSVIDVDRDFPMVLLAIIFALVVVGVGRLRGLLALVGLVITFGVLTLFILPGILQGSNPLVVAVIGGSLIMLVTLYLCHGLTARTSVAVLGTLISLVLIGLLGSLFIGWANLSGNTDDQTALVHSLYPDIEIRGLLLASVLIGSLGVLDDVTVTQTSAVWELKAADPSASWRQVYRSAMRIGRDHIASVVNTLVLAYAGAAMPLLLLFSIAKADTATVATSELVAEEIVRTLVGSIGLVASVPVTTVLAALVVSAGFGRDGEPPIRPAGGDGADGTGGGQPGDTWGGGSGGARDGHGPGSGGASDGNAPAGAGTSSGPGSVRGGLGGGSGRRRRAKR
ncbi:YibE/F family protein [Streptomyces sp. P38-E01]|uniref:YibE/F family protein n=1 Tax=Streptomyces tardus TaxID=2780544 RepID=A0A949N7S8_9ACTN|nr:YibE/F family protein [Streptomyces tardus]